jgi:hypothetical protein
MSDYDDTPTPTLTITRAQYDEFVESAEDHTILWTDTLALIGVKVGDVPDVDVIEAQADIIAQLRAKNYRLERRIEWLEALAQETQP